MCVTNKRYYSPSDRDYMVRTIIGEAANEPDEGQAAVAHVILNRVNKGFGATPTQVIFAKNQFEPWGTRREELMSYAPTDPAYVRAAKIVDDVIAGKIKDPTEGATHFLQEETVRARRGGDLPDWAKGRRRKFGAHTFFRPGDDDGWGDGPSIIDKYTKKGEASTAAPVESAAAPVESAAAPAPLPSVVERYTKKDPSMKPVPAGAARIGAIDEPVVLPEGKIAAPPSDSGPTSFVGKSAERLAGGVARDVLKVARGALALPGRFRAALVDNAATGLETGKQGLIEMMQGNILPSGDIADPSTWQMGGALRTATGAAGAVLAPVTAATQELIERPVAEATGNQRFAERVGMVSNVFPASIAVRSVNRLRPTVQARESIGGVSMIGDELARLEANPRLTPMDVNPMLRQQAMGIYNEPGKGKTILFNRVQERKTSAPDAVREAYDEAMGAAPNVRETLKGYQATARKNAREGFGKAFEGVKFVNVRPVLDFIRDELKPGATGVMSPTNQLAYGPYERELIKLRNTLSTDRSILTDPARLHEIQSKLRKDIYLYSKSTDGASKKLASDLKGVHSKLVDSIDEATGGKYKPARAKYRDDMQIEEAFDRGLELTSNPATKEGMLHYSPDAWRDWMKTATAEEVKAAQLGARAMIEQKIMGFRHSARRGTDIEDVPYNREKFEILFGKDEAKRLQQLLRDERDIAMTNSKLTANSDTAERLAGQSMVKVRPKETPTNMGAYLPPVAAELGAMALGSPSGVGFGIGSAMVGGRVVANRLARWGEIARNERMADILSTPGEEGRARLLQSMRAAGENRLVRPVPPVTYIPPEARERRPVPLKKD